MYAIFIVDTQINNYIFGYGKVISYDKEYCNPRLFPELDHCESAYINHYSLYFCECYQKFELKYHEQLGYCCHYFDFCDDIYKYIKTISEYFK